MSFFWLRTSLSILAGVLGVAAIWTLGADMLSPRLPYFPADAKEAAIFSDARGFAVGAANIGRIRGDLWTAAAVAEAAPLLFAEHTGADNKDALQQARDTASRAAYLSPHDSRNWLLLADLDSRLEQSSPKATEALKLSYYTAPNEFALAPLRLAVAARVSQDEELQGLVQSEIQRILLKRPNLKPAIASAYRSAIPASRAIFEATLKDADPAFLATLASTPNPK
jgi:hypothetical protein